MNFGQILRVVILMMSAFLVVEAQQPIDNVKSTGQDIKAASRTPAGRASRRKKRTLVRPVIPPATVLHNPEYLSGEASVVVAANTNPLIRLGMAQNGVTLVEFPVTDRFFAVHAGNSDLVTVEKSPSLKRDHHLILRAGSGFLVPAVRPGNAERTLPATSIITQMDTGMAITFMIYPVPLLKQQAHRVVITYKHDEVISARKAAGLATNLTAVEPASRVEATDEIAPVLGSKNEIASTSEPVKESQLDLQALSEAAIKEGMSNPQWFKTWTKPKHGLSLSTRPPLDLNDTQRLILFVVKNTGTQALRLISGYPDLIVETLNEQQKPFDIGTRVNKLHLASDSKDKLIAPGVVRYFAVIYEAPMLGVRQRLKLVVAHTNAADEPATAELGEAAN